MQEEIDLKFRAAWDVFSMTCSRFLATEATYQAWFAHYLISQFGIDRVAREPIIKSSHFDETEWTAKVGRGELKLDIVVTREPGIHLPHYANERDRSIDGSGLHRLASMAIITELKVTATQGVGGEHGEIARDAYKLSVLLRALERSGVRADQLPRAYLCVLDNHPRKGYERKYLDKRFAGLGHDPAIEILSTPHRRSTAPGSQRRHSHGGMWYED